MSGYTFDDDFQTKVAALAVRDATFNIRTDGLIDPSYFANEAEATLVSLVQRYWSKYHAIPSLVVLKKLITAAISSKIIREDMREDVKDVLRNLLKENLSDRDYVIDEVASFARHQAIFGAMEAAIPALDNHDFETIETKMKQAFLVGANDAGEGRDFADSIKARAERRLDIATGKVIPGITTGFKDFDERLAGKGFQRKELSVLLGPAKRGKSFGLMNFAVNAMIAGFNVLFVSLENSLEVTEDRMDAYLSQTKTADLLKNIKSVQAAVEKKMSAKNVGILKMHKYPTGSFAPRDLKRLVENYRAKGIIFDEIVVDYWDIMAPDVRYRDDSIKESASIGIGLRAIADEENAAVVTAIQSNRDGFKAHTAGAEHAAEDFNKVRLADVLFSINADDDERAMGEARIYLAAVRNVEGGYTINIQQDLSKATFISKVLGRSGV